MSLPNCLTYLVYTTPSTDKKIANRIRAAWVGVLAVFGQRNPHIRRPQNHRSRRVLSRQELLRRHYTRGCKQNFLLLIMRRYFCLLQRTEIAISNY